MKIYINSIETMGLVDGPGIRYVVFMQGCPLRCIYCHNPETWKLNDYNKAYEVDKLIEDILKYKNYFKNNGGVTFSGGEPLFQKEALLEALKLCKKHNIHTCIDTAGSIRGFEEILNYTDLVLLDIKGIGKMYKNITGQDDKIFLEFINYCKKINKDIWLRDVIVPGINDNKKHIIELVNFVKNYDNIKKVELLPYHTLGVSKYKKLHINYKLENTKSMDVNKCKAMEEQLNKLLECKSVKEKENN